MQTTYQPLAPAHIDELFTIWASDKRIPTVESRRAWSIARNLKPDHVHRWWARRKQLAKKAREKLPKGTYELPVGEPPVIEIKQQTSPTPTPPMILPSPRGAGRGIKDEPLDDVDLDRQMNSDSSDTLVALSHSSLPPASSPFTAHESSPGPLPLDDVECYRLSIFLRQNTPECRPETTNNYRNEPFCTQDPSSEGQTFTCSLCKPDPDYPKITIEENEETTLSPVDPLLTPQQQQDDYSTMGLSVLPFLLRSPDLLSFSNGSKPASGLSWATKSRICIDGQSFTLDGMLVEPCLCFTTAYMCPHWEWPSRIV